MNKHKSFLRRSDEAGKGNRYATFNEDASRYPYTMYGEREREREKELLAHTHSDLRKITAKGEDLKAPFFTKSGRKLCNYCLERKKVATLVESALLPKQLAYISEALSFIHHRKIAFSLHAHFLSSQSPSWSTDRRTTFFSVRKKEPLNLTKKDAKETLDVDDMRMMESRTSTHFD